MTAAMLRCNRCGEGKPVDDFYVSRTRGTGREARCIACDNARNRQTPARMLRTRARQRATAAIVQAHADEFREMYAHCYEVALQEWEMLAQQPESDQHPGEPVRLRPGPARQGEDVLDRINPDPPKSCRHCADAHSTGHVCPDCGASPEVNEANERLDREVFLEDVEYLLDTGETHALAIAGRLRMTVEAMTRRLNRYGRADLIVCMDATGRQPVGAA